MVTRRFNSSILLIFLVVFAFVSCGKKTITNASIASAVASAAAYVASATDPPILSDPGSKLFPGSYYIQSTPYTIDFDNSNISADTGMTYTCYFDREVDGVVAATDLCSTLTGAGAFNTATGVISWTPSAAAWGPYEIKVTGTNAYGTGSRIIVADVHPAISTTNIVRYFDAQFATTSGGQGVNTPSFTSSIPDLKSALGSTVGSLSGFAQTTASGWAGQVTVAAPIANPYRLVFDGVDDYVDFSTIMNSYAEMQFDTWIKPANVTQTARTILTNGDATGKGMTLTQRSGGKLQLVLGTSSYYDEVKKSSPISYWRMKETATGAAADEMGTNAATINGAGTYTYNQTSPIHENITAIRFTGAAGTRVNVPFSTTLRPNGGQFTLEMWIRFNTAFTGATKDIAQMGLTSGETYWDIKTNGTGLNFGYYDTTFHYYKDFTWAQLGFAVDTWYHLAYVIDNANSIARIFVNGSQIGTDTPLDDSGSPRANNTASLTYFGGSPANGGTDITMQDFAIYGSALSGTTLTTHYNAAFIPTCSSSTAMANGSWYDISGAWDNTGNALKLFVNGASECSYTHTGAYTINGGSANLKMGIDAANTATSAWSGAVGDLKLYDAYSAGRAATNNAATRY